MSCFRCGKDLPEYQTECEPFCIQPGADNAAGTEAYCINMVFFPIRENLKDDQAIAEFQAAMQAFLHAVNDEFKKSGLSKFCKRNQ